MLQAGFRRQAALDFGRGFEGPRAGIPSAENEAPNSHGKEGGAFPPNPGRAVISHTPRYQRIAGQIS